MPDRQNDLDLLALSPKRGVDLVQDSEAPLRIAARGAGAEAQLDIELGDRAGGEFLEQLVEARWPSRKSQRGIN